LHFDSAFQLLDVSIDESFLVVGNGLLDPLGRNTDGEICGAAHELALGNPDLHVDLGGSARATGAFGRGGRCAPLRRRSPPRLNAQGFSSAGNAFIFRSISSICAAAACVSAAVTRSPRI
jgi:hypothetical protein